MEDEEYFVEPLWNTTSNSRAGHLHIVYKRSDIRTEDGSTECGLTAANGKTKISLSSLLMKKYYFITMYSINGT